MTRLAVILIAALMFLGSAGVVAAQMTCTPNPDGTQTCEARAPIGEYLIEASACDAAGNCAVVKETAVPLAPKLEMRQEGGEFVWTWVVRQGMTVTFTATPR